MMVLWLGHECFFILPDIAGQVYSNRKSKELLGWEPVDTLEAYWTRATPPGASSPPGARL